MKIKKKMGKMFCFSFLITEYRKVRTKLTAGTVPVAVAAVQLWSTLTSSNDF